MAQIILTMVIACINIINDDHIVPNGFLITIFWMLKTTLLGYVIKQVISGIITDANTYATLP